MMLLLRILAYPKAKIQIRTHKVKKYSFNFIFIKCHSID